MRGGAVVAVALACALLAGCGDSEPQAAQPAAGATIESIETEDGLRLDARLFAAGDGDRVVILLHMFPADQRSWYAVARELQARGVSALTLDFRGYRASEGPKDVALIDRDVRAAVRFTRERRFDRILLAGASMGGTAAIIVGAEQALPVVALSAPASFRGLDATAVRPSGQPVLLIAAEQDESAQDALERLASQADETLLVAGQAHGTDLFAGDGGERVSARFFAFVSAALGAPAD